MIKKKEGIKILRIIFYIIAAIIMLWSVITIFAFIVFNHKMVESYPHVPSLIFHILGIIAWGNIIGMIALIRYRKWGFWLYLGVTIAVIILYLIGKMNFFLAISGIIGPIIVYLLLRPRWRELK